MRARPRSVLLGFLASILVLGAATAVGAAPQTPTVPDNRGLGSPVFNEHDVLATLYEWALGYDDQSLDFEDRLALMENAFTEDSSFIYEAVGFHAEWHGIDEVMSLFEGALEAQDDVRRHVLSNELVERVDRRTVKVTSYLTLTVVADPAEGPYLESTGIYRDTLVLESDGKWRIQERHLTLDTPPA